MKTGAKDLYTEGEQAVIDFVVWFIADDRMTVTTDTLLVRDLGIDGKDALRFLTRFSKRFNVDISNFPEGEYFHDKQRGGLASGGWSSRVMHTRCTT